MLDREVKTTVGNILDLVNCAKDYGYYDDVLMVSLAEITGYVTDEEIKRFCTLTQELSQDGYTREDVEEDWLYELTEWRDKYCKQD